MEIPDYVSAQAGNAFVAGNTGKNIMDQVKTDHRAQALSLLRAGRLDAARAAYEGLLSAAPDDADLLGRLGMLELQQQRHEDAETWLRRSLEPGADRRIHLRNLINLMVLLARTGRNAEARELVAAEVPDWPEGVPADASERGSVLSLARALFGYGQPGKARRLLDRALPERSGDAAALTLDGRLRLGEGDAAAAVEILARAAELAPDHHRPLIPLSYAQDQLGRRDAARTTVRRIAQRWAYSAPQRPSQRATILVLNAAPENVRDPNSGLRGFHFSINYATQIAVSMRDEYRFLSLFADLPADKLPERLPAADVVLNNIVNSEKMCIPGRLDIVRAAVERIGRPVINHPDQVFQTTRQKNALLLESVPNLKVPRIRRYRADLGSVEEIVAHIGERFDYPVILRLATAHQSPDSLLTEEGKVAVLLPDPAALHDHLERCGWREFYAVEFVDLKRKDGFYRKMRAAFVGREVIVTKPAIYREWMVNDWRHKPAGIEFYRANPRTIEECNRISADPEAHLGATAMRTLETIRDRLPLDMFGLDFEVDREGRVVFFETSAAMIFQPVDLQSVPPDVRLPMEPFIRIDDAFRELVARRIAELPLRSA
jgi:Flp pilus assembly protein TadD